jgi:hypothetical protein
LFHNQAQAIVTKSTIQVGIEATALGSIAAAD